MRESSQKPRGQSSILLPYFLYWLAFFLFLEGLLITAVIYVLVMVIRSALPTVSAADPAGASALSGILNDAVVKGIIGNAAFYLYILAAFVLLKAMGGTDRLWQALWPGSSVILSAVAFGPALFTRLVRETSRD